MIPDDKKDPDVEPEDEEVIEVIKKVRENEEEKYPPDLKTGTRGAFITIIRKYGDRSEEKKDE